MDFSQLDEWSRLEFLRKHGQQGSGDLINEVNQLWTELNNEGKLTIENLTFQVMDLYLATSLKPQVQGHPKYLKSQILAADYPTLLQFQQQFKIPFTSSPTISDYEFLRNRIVQILDWLDLLQDDTFTPDRKVQVWKTDIHAYWNPVDREDQELFGQENIGNDFIVASLDERFIDKIKEFAKEKGTELRRGDIIEDLDEGYRNEDRFIFDGEQIIELDTNIDDYGALPSSFSFPEFPLNYWYVNDNYAIDHNEYQWIDLTQFKDELTKNMRGPFYPINREDITGLTPVELDIESSESKIYQSYIIHNGKTYNFVIPVRDGSDMPSFNDGLISYENGYFVFG